MTVRIRGIYATALTELLHDERGVVQASPAIDERFDDATFPADPATVSIETSDDRQGVGLVGDLEAVGETATRLREGGRDALAWADPLPRGAVFAGEVTETLGGGAVVDLGDGVGDRPDTAVPVASRPLEGYLPFGATDDRIETGDRLLVQVAEPRPPWSGDRPVLDTTVRVHGGLVTLVRGGAGDTGGRPTLADVLPDDPRDGWGARWHDASEDADLDALADALATANDRATALDEALADAPAVGEAAPAHVATDEATAWVWFGRESRFALDDHRRAVTPTMVGHHRIKAGADAASAAVDFVEAVQADGGAAAGSREDADADGGGVDTDADGGEGSDEQFPFAATTRHFGPREGDQVAIGHGKPDGRLFTLGRATVTDVDPEGSVTLEREMSPGGTYDGLGIERCAGDVATTSVTEGRWWYPTVYRSSEGERRGTYVNVCTPVEVFPDGVRYVDLHVDVVKHADGTVERLDDDELDAAEAAGFLTAELARKARDVASAVERAL